jgi:exodeoxyribonuclease V alpha subunit
MIARAAAAKTKGVTQQGSMGNSNPNATPPTSFVMADALKGTGFTKRLAERAEKKASGQESAADDLEAAAEVRRVAGLDAQFADTALVALDYDEYQERVIHDGINEMYFNIIGPAGVGKTTTTKRLVKAIEPFLPKVSVNSTRIESSQVEQDYKVPAVAFCAYTGRAVQNMKRALPREYHPVCQTIHATLGYAPDHTEMDANGKKKIIFRPTFNAFRKLPYKLIIIDEASMPPTDLMNELIDALPRDCRIICIGDINQLPPVKGRSTLGFTMSKWPTFELKKIHRQAAGSPIISNAHRILNGQRPTEALMQFDMVHLHMDGSKTYGMIQAIVRKLHSAGQFDPFRDALIVPQNKGILGQVALNEALVTYFNPPNEQGGIVVNPRTLIQTGITTEAFAVHDKVMLLQNDRKRELTNGMIGVVTAITLNGAYDQKRGVIHSETFAHTLDTDFDLADALGELGDTGAETGTDDDEDAKEKEDDTQRQASHIMEVKFADRDDVVTFSTSGQYRNITHSYAFTCHKAQGGEYPTVIVLAHSHNLRMLTREWLYTAVTRAQKRVILVYNNRGLNHALNNQRIKGHSTEAKIASFIALEKMKAQGLNIIVPNLPAPQTREFVTL